MTGLAVSSPRDSSSLAGSSLAPSSPDRSPPAPDAPAPGVTRVTARAARRLVEGVVTHRFPEIVDPDVDVHLDEHDITRGELRVAVSLSLPYGHDPLSHRLATVRRALAEEAARCLGRPPDRIDLLVTRLLPDGGGA